MNASLLFILGLGLLFIGGEGVVKGAVFIAEKNGFPKILVGATIVSVGTTLPEVVVSCGAAAEGSAGISYGNAIGSVICNASLIAAVLILRRPGKVDKKAFRLPAAVFFAAALVYSAVAWTAGRFSRTTGIALLVICAVYFAVTVRYIKNDPRAARNAGTDEDEGPKPKTQAEAILWLIAGIAAVAAGARLLVNNGTVIAKALGVPDSVIGLTMVALGTSLPELVVAFKSSGKHPTLALGNVIGANILNIVLVSGMAITISPFEVPAEKTVGGINSSFVIDLPLMLIVMAVLCLPALKKGRVERWQGIALLCLFAAFNVYQFIA